MGRAAGACGWLMVVVVWIGKVSKSIGFLSIPFEWLSPSAAGHDPSDFDRIDRL
jgi:hypothetical protein